MVSRIGAGEAGVYELVQQLLITDAMGDGIEPLMLKPIRFVGDGGPTTTDS